MQEVTPEQAKEWRAREEARFNDGIYTPLPNSWRDMRWFWADDYSRMRYPDHFAHISIEQVSMIAFTENDQKGIRDRQTRMSPGKYLARFFSDVLTPHEIQVLATELGARFNADAELMFAVTADEFEEIYTTGPNSCMSHEASFFASKVHPVRVYAGHDLQLAYIKREGRVTARALCWPDRLRYGRVYGDSVRLIHMLGQIGYKEGTLSGAKITRLMDGDEYVIPYLDYLQGAVDKGTHLLLSDGSHNGCDIASDRQNGLSEERNLCTNCSCALDEDASSDDNGNYYCESCYDDRYGYCERTQDTCRRDELEEVRTSRRSNGNWRTQDWGQYARDNHAFYCDVDSVWYSDDNDPVVIRGETWGPDAVEDNAVMCEATEEYIHVDDSVTLEDGTVWASRHFKRYGVTIEGKLYDQDNLPEGEEAPARKGSPTVVCDAQIEAPLVVQGLHIKKVDDRYWVMDGDKEADSYAFWCEDNAEIRLAELIAERAKLIVAGCWVECIETYTTGTAFTAGNLYYVTRVFTEYDTPRISVRHDDQGRENGWTREKFRFHSMPKTGLHIRHEPNRPSIPYLGVAHPWVLYDGDRYINAWSQERYAQSGLEAYVRRTLHFHPQPEEVAI